jgi:hypothetical protein
VKLFIADGDGRPIQEFLQIARAARAIGHHGNRADRARERKDRQASQPDSQYSRDQSSEAHVSIPPQSCRAPAFHETACYEASVQLECVAHQALCFASIGCASL